MLITNRGDSFSDVLIDALDEASSVLIAAGYVTPLGCELLDLQALSRRIPVRLIVGRAGTEGLTEGTYNFLQALHDEAVDLGGGVRIGQPSFHSKIFCVEHDDSHLIWVGSSNLTSQGIQGGLEATVPVDPPEAAQALEEAEALWASGIPIPDAELRLRAPGGRTGGATIRRKSETEEDEERPPPDQDLEEAPSFCVELTQRGRVPEKSGLNWWNGSGRTRDPNEAYLPLRAAKRDEARRVFGELRADLPFRAVGHDGRRIDMQLEGEGGKNIASQDDKRIFGEWILRDVLELDEEELLTADHLEIWGRSDICLYRAGTHSPTGTPLVYIDFSPPPIAGTSDEPWTEEETRLALRAYFLMFKQELAGEDYTKARHRDRAMKRLPARTPDSLEFKFRNVSAVLAEMGLDWLDGYAPREHHERTLVPALVAEHLERNPDLRAELSGGNDDQ